MAIILKTKIIPKTQLAETPTQLTNPKRQSRYDYASLKHPKVIFDDSDPNSRSVTNQSDKDSTDINIIMARYQKTGLITDILGNSRPPQYGDFTDVGDFHQLQITISRVTEAFNAYPASIRSRFQNDPAKLIEFLSDPQNDAEAIKLGLKTLIDPEKDPNEPDSEASPAIPQGAIQTPGKLTTYPPPKPGVGDVGGGT